MTDQPTKKLLQGKNKLYIIMMIKIKLKIKFFKNILLQCIIFSLQHFKLLINSFNRFAYSNSQINIIQTYLIYKSYHQMHNEAEQEAKFKASLNEFQIQNNLKKNEEIDGSYNDFKLYKLICRHGGCQAVTNRKYWPDIAQELKIDDVTRLKSYYIKFLHAYEQKYYFGREQEQQLPNLLCGNPRKMLKPDPNKQKQKIQENSTLQLELAKYFQQKEKKKKLFYLKKKKLAHTKAETKKIILGLQSFQDKTEIIYSLNMLLLYSINVHEPFLFETHEKIFSALQSYLCAIYPPKYSQQLEHLRTITLIIRNLTLCPKNLKYMLGTRMFNVLITIFNTGLDQECSKNIVDTMNGLVKVGWDCNQIVKQLNDAILDDKIQEVQNCLEMLRGLVDERQDSLVQAVNEHLKVFIRVLLSLQVSIQMKEQVMEILSFATDVSMQSKTIFLKNSQLLSIIIGILYSMRNQEKLAQFAALTLNNISTVTGSRAYLKAYESQLMLIGFTDDSLAGIIANILADIANG